MDRVGYERTSPAPLRQRYGGIVVVGEPVAGDREEVIPTGRPAGRPPAAAAATITTVDRCDRSTVSGVALFSQRVRTVFGRLCVCPCPRLVFSSVYVCVCSTVVVLFVCVRRVRETGGGENGVTWVAASRIARRLGQVYGTKSSRTTNPPTDVGRFLVPVAVACKCYR